MTKSEVQEFRDAVQVGLRRGWIRFGPPPLSEKEIETVLRHAAEERKRLGLSQKRAKHA